MVDTRVPMSIRAGGMNCRMKESGVGIMPVPEERMTGDMEE